MKTILYLAAGYAAFSFGAKKGPRPRAQPSPPAVRCQGRPDASTIVVPDTLKPFAGFGNPNIVAQRAAERDRQEGGSRVEAHLARVWSVIVSIRRRPGRFLFAFGRPDVLAARRAERCAKWEWSEEFLNKARPDKFGVGNYGAGDLATTA